MPRLKQPSRLLDANFRLPIDLTPILVQSIDSLCPSTGHDYLKTQVFSKFVSKDTAPSSVRRQRAISKWLATERNNEATNERLLSVDPGYNILPRVRYDRFMTKVASIITDVLGEVVPDSVLNGAFSSGASTSRRRSMAHPSQKYVGKADVTSSCLPLANLLLEDSRIWAEFRNSDEYQIVEGNVLFTVPKTTDIDRCACKEPDINMYFQKGAGSFIRKRLRRFGISLNDQSRNQALARRGSLDGSLATVDLSSASDSISYELVAQCLPMLWFSLLCDLRSPVTIIDGERHVNEMFSSMGNGFTFELESLLFWAISRAVAYFTRASGAISVYGDDIIVPSVMCQDLLFVLEFLGFSANTDKTFYEGTFRESCGGHYSNGCSITPFYIRKPIDSLRDVITVSNQIREWSRTEGIDILGCELEETWNLLSTFVPKCFWGGQDTGDSSRLVSAWRPEKPKRLVAVNHNRRSGDGGYLMWLDSRWDESPNDRETSLDDEGLESSSYAQFTGRFRSKPVRFARGGSEYVFLGELFPSTVT